jgi:hypothetical protein
MLSLQHWNGLYFEKVTLKSLGIRIQLGHCAGESCFSPKPAQGGSFIVLDHNGIHDVNLDFCGCYDNPHHYLQLLHFGWYPATIGNPRTAATFRMLNHFHKLTFESKCSALEYFQTLHRLSDNTGLDLPKVGCNLIIVINPS